MKKKILTVFLVTISLIVILVVGDLYWRYRQYVEMSKPKVKENLTKEEMDIIYDEFELVASEKYKIQAIYFQFGEELRAYIPVGKNYDEFLKEVCGWSEKDVGKIKKEIYCDGKVSQEYSAWHINMFEKEVSSINFCLREDGAYYKPPKIYIWQEESGYIVEIVRNDGNFENSIKIKEMFPELKWVNEIGWIKMIIKEKFS